MRTPRELQAACLEKIAATYREAERIYGRTFKPPTVRFDLHTSGRLGCAYYHHNLIRLHPGALELPEQSQRYIDIVPGHEAAHLITDALHHGKHTRTHGREWQAVMRQLGMVPNANQQNITTPQAIRRRARALASAVPYHCSCKTFRLSGRYLAKARTGVKLTCRTCKAPLEPGEYRPPAPPERIAATTTAPERAPTPPPSPATPSGAMRQLRLF